MLLLHIALVLQLLLLADRSVGGRHGSHWYRLLLLLHLLVHVGWRQARLLMPHRRRLPAANETSLVRLRCELAPGVLRGHRLLVASNLMLLLLNVILRNLWRCYLLMVGFHGAISLLLPLVASRQPVVVAHRLAASAASSHLHLLALLEPLRFAMVVVVLLLLVHVMVVGTCVAVLGFTWRIMFKLLLRVHYV